MEATSDQRTHKQCGDDLIGLFTPRQEGIYRTTLEDDLRLKYNQRKSFVGQRGRFCENHVRIVHSDEKETLAACRPGPKIAEIVGARELNGFTDNPVTMTEGLAKLCRHHKSYVRQGAEVTLKKLERRIGLVPNLPLTMGGSGRIAKKVTKEQINCLFKYMSNGRGIPMTGCLTEGIREEINRRMPEGKSSGLVSVSDYRVHRLIQISRHARLQSGDVLGAQQTSVVAFRRQAYSRRKTLLQSSNPSISDKFLQRKTKARVRNIQTLSNRLKQSSRELRKLANFLVRAKRENHIPRQQLQCLLRDDWNQNLWQNGARKRLLGLDPPANAE